MKRFFLIMLLGLVLSACSQEGDQPSEKIPAMDIPDSPPPADSWWQPGLGLSWQWQLTGKFDFDVKADVYDIDLHVHESAVEHFHNQGAKVICYISVGSFENWREDVDQFPEEVLGNEYEGWSGERWLDIRRIDLLAPVMLARLDKCAEKGFDGVEPDNMEVLSNDTGFPITYKDQLRYAVWLANEAHARGLAIGLKNAPEMAEDLVDLYDFVITEDCFHYDWCEEMLPFIKAGKPVFAAEYTDLDGDFSEYCQLSDQLGLSTILKRRNLSAWVKNCP